MASDVKKYSDREKKSGLWNFNWEIQRLTATRDIVTKKNKFT